METPAEGDPRVKPEDDDTGEERKARARGYFDGAGAPRRRMISSSCSSVR